MTDRPGRDPGAAAVTDREWVHLAERTFLLDPLLRLVRSLRAAGVPVSSSEAIDATWAFRSIDIGDRAQVRSALAATLIKRAEDQAAFETLFDLHFAIRGRRPTGTPGAPDAIADALAVGRA